jgi:hypothetical protein
MTEHRVVYDYEARTEKEISLTKGDTVIVLREDSSGWAEGRCPVRNVQGWFPSTFIEAISAGASASKAVVDDKKKDRNKGKRMSTRFFGKGQEKVKAAIASVGSPFHLIFSATAEYIFYTWR